MAIRVRTYISRLASSGQVPLQLVSLKLAGGDDFWCLMFSTKKRLAEFQEALPQNPKISEYGQILYSGFGEDPPEYVIKKVTEEYNLKLAETAN